MGSAPPYGLTKGSMDGRSPLDDHVDTGCLHVMRDAQFMLDSSVAARPDAPGAHNDGEDCKGSSWPSASSRFTEFRVVVDSSFCLIRLV